MTDTTDPRALVQRIKFEAVNSEIDKDLAGEIINALTAALDRAEKAEAENKRLTLAVSYANLNADTAWNDAIEAASAVAITCGMDRLAGGIVALKKGAKL